MDFNSKIKIWRFRPSCRVLQAEAQLLKANGNYLSMDSIIPGQDKTKERIKKQSLFYLLYKLLNEAAKFLTTEISKS